MHRARDVAPATHCAGDVAPAIYCAGADAPAIIHCDRENAAAIHRAGEDAPAIHRARDVAPVNDRNNKGAIRKDGKKLTIAQRKKKPRCGSSRMGCVQCDEHICDDCWKKGYDKHKGMPKK